MQGASYANMAEPTAAPQRQGKPVFVMHNNIPGENRVELEEMYKSLSKSVHTKDIHGIQKIGGLWRLYVVERENRIKLITEGLQIRDTSVRVYDKNPYLPHENENATRVLIKDIPLSVHESVIMDEFEKRNYKVNGPIMYPKLRVDGKLTQCLTGDRVVYIDAPTQPLPRFMQFQNFRARVFHHGQPDPESNVTCSRCLQAGHHRSKCSNQVVCRLCKKVGHMQSMCPTTAGKEEKQQSTRPKTRESRSAQSGDRSRGEAVPLATNSPNESHPDLSTASTARVYDQPARGTTSSVPQTRSMTASSSQNRERGSRDRRPRPREGAVLDSADFRARSNSAPNIGDAQTKITEYWRKSADSESESERSCDETEEEQEEITLNSQQLSIDHEKRSRKRRRKNTKMSNGK